MSTYNIGLIGYGYLGKSLHESLQDTAVSVTHIYNRSASRLESLSKANSFTDINTFISAIAELDLVVELAHPDISREVGVEILKNTNYMPCSVAALADNVLKQQLIDSAKQHNNRLLVPHGAVVGIDSIHEYRHDWDKVTITFRKPPAALELENTNESDETILFDGSVKDIASKFPRNVNAMVACALASIGVENTQARIIADTRQGNMLRGEFEFHSTDGSTLSIIKQEPAVGVSSPGMINSLKGSVLRALGINEGGLEFV